MTHLRIKKIEIQGFRSYGPEPQVAEIEAPISVFWGPNSKGKTSLGEGVEFLLTGLTVKRELLASRQDEFADALRHAHLQDDVEAYVAMIIECENGQTHKIKRVLDRDYSKQKDCQSSLYIDGVKENEEGLERIGIVLSQPPLRAPVLAQHTLNYLFTTKPSDRSTYFKALLEVSDLDQVRAAVAGLEAELAIGDDRAFEKLANAMAVPAVASQLGQADLTDKNALRSAFERSAKAILEAEGLPVPPGFAERVEAVEGLLAAKRSATFPVDLFARKPFPALQGLNGQEWATLGAYIAQKAKVEEETSRLAALFRAALEVPAVQGDGSAVDCPLCGTPEALTPQRLAFIRDSVAQTEGLHKAEADALRVLADLRSTASALSVGAEAATPRFAARTSKLRRQVGFRIPRIRALLDESAEAVLSSWLEATRTLWRARRLLKQLASALGRLVEAFIAEPATIKDYNPILSAFTSATQARDDFVAAEQAYSAAVRPLFDTLRAAVDAKSDTAGWQDFIELVGELDSLRAAAVEREVLRKVVAEVRSALKQIDKGIEKVLDDKFADLSCKIEEWWNRLRGGEATFFASVKRRGRATIDFKGGLSTHGDHRSAKIRDVISVFSDSQLHCLGLAIFLARAEAYGMSFVVLDDPILSSDEDYRAHFRTRVIGALCELNIQVIVLTQHKGTRRDIFNANQHRGVDQFQIEIADPARGSEIIKTGDELSEMLASAEAFTISGAEEIRKEGGRRLRVATERLCKAILVRKRRDTGDDSATISDYDGQMLGGKNGLIAQVTPYLSLDASHAGKLRTIHDDLNPSSHDDDDVPPRQALVDALGNLRRLRRDYLI